MKTKDTPATWIAFGFFLLGFSLFSLVMPTLARGFLDTLGADLKPYITSDDPRGADAAFMLLLMPFWFLGGLLAGMLSVNLSHFLHQSARSSSLPYAAFAGYLLVTYGLASLTYGIIHGS